MELLKIFFWVCIIGISVVFWVTILWFVIGMAINFYKIHLKKKKATTNLYDEKLN